MCYSAREERSTIYGELQFPSGNLKSNLQRSGPGVLERGYLQGNSLRFQAAETTLSAPHDSLHWLESENGEGICRKKPHGWPVFRVRTDSSSLFLAV